MKVDIRLSIRDRLLIGNVALVALSLLLFAACARFVIGKVIMGSLDSSLERAAREWVKNPEEPHPGPGPEGRRPDRNGQPGGPQGGPGQDPLRERPRGPQGQFAQGPPNGPPQSERIPGLDFGPSEMPPGQQGNMDSQGPSNPDDPRHDRARAGSKALRVFRRPIMIPPSDEGLAQMAQHEYIYSADSFHHAMQTKHNDWGESTDPDDGQLLRVLSYPVRDEKGQITGVLQLAAPRSDTDRAVSGVTFGLTLLLPVIAVIAGIGGTVMTRRALSPVGKLADAAMHIEANRLSERLPETGGGDEFDRLARMLNSSLARLEESFARQKRFAADASHELRTPLAVIKTATSMLRGNESLPLPLIQEAIQEADDATDRANRLVSDLLFFARTESGTLPVRPSQTRINDILQRAARDAEATYRRNTPNATEPAAITIECPANLSLYTDGELVLRSLINLLYNALRHTPSTGKVIIQARGIGISTVAIVVFDTGPGIAPEHLARLGEPFYRPDRARGREEGGAGLGISIVRAILRTLGGTMQITSEVGRGTQITVTLPPYSPSDATAAALQTAQK